MAEKAKFFETIVLQLKKVDSKSTLERYVNEADARRKPSPQGKEGSRSVAQREEGAERRDRDSTIFADPLKSTEIFLIMIIQGACHAIAI